MAEVVIDIIGRDNFSSTLGNFGNIMTGIQSTINLVGQAFDAAVGAVSPFINAATESEDAVANLESTLRSMGDVTGLTSQQLQDIAGGLQQVTRYSDETILNGEAMLLTFGNIGGDVFPRATEAMVDLAAKFGSVDQASVMLGKALNDPIAGVTALRRVGVQLSDQQEEAIKKFMAVGDIASAQGVILGELERQVGGLAEAYGDTFAGKLEIFKNRLGEVQETIGRAILPVLTQLLDWAMQFMPMIVDFGDRIANVFNAIADSGLFSAETREAILGGIFGVDSISELFAKADAFIGNVVDALTNAVENWAAGPGPQQLSDRLVSFIDNFGSGGQFDSKALTAIVRLTDALSRAILAVDWGRVANAFAAAIVPVFDRMEVTGTNAVRNFFNGIEISITDAVRGWFDGIELDVTGWVRDKIVNPIKAFLGISSPSTVFLEIGKNIVQGLWDGMKSMWNSFVDWVGTSIGAILSTLTMENIWKVITTDLTLSELLQGAYTNTASSSSTGSYSGGTSISSGSTSTAGGSVVNQYFAGATINVGSWDEIAYDCIYPNPFVSATSGQLTGPMPIPAGSH